MDAKCTAFRVDPWLSSTKSDKYTYILERTGHHALSSHACDQRSLLAYQRKKKESEKNDVK
jgi:hypothetical protein